MQARQKAQLTKFGQDQKDEINSPSISFVENPKIAAKSVLELHRRRKMLGELKGMEKNVGNHKDGYARMNDRENAGLRLLADNQQSTMTMKILDQKRRQEMVEDNNSKFGNVTIGIHGGELPKFSNNQSNNNSPEWWKLQRGLNKEDPKI